MMRNNTKLNTKTFDEYLYNVKLQLGQKKVRQNRRNELSSIFARLNQHEYQRMLMFDYNMYVSDCTQNNKRTDEVFQKHIRQTVDWLAM